MARISGAAPVRTLTWVWVLIFACFVAGVSLIITDTPLASSTATGSAINYSPAYGPAVASNSPQALTGVYKVIGWNDLGMHCMNENFSNMAVLPPFNTMWAQVVKQGDPPSVITTSVAVDYSIIDNTYSDCRSPKGCKTNFWQYSSKLFPTSPYSQTPNVGIKGATLSGTMQTRPDHFVVEGIPLTPYLDSAPAFTPANWYPYQRAHMVAHDTSNGQVLADTIAVAPVSTEMRCDTCHAQGKDPGGPYTDVELNILSKHDSEEVTQLMNQRPVLCANCHGSNALGAPDQPGIPSLSFAMHNRHRLSTVANAPSTTADGTNNCYLCHPGQQTQCLRDVMYAQGLTCINCHGDTGNVASSQLAPTNRQPWLNEPSCAASGCHASQYAPNPNTLYRNSVGHGGMYCEACHGSPHAILPTIQPNDNLQNIALQGHAGVLNDCRVCHSQPPTNVGPHGISYWSSVQGQISTTAGSPVYQVDASGGIALTTTTTLTGFYTLLNLPPGVYTLTPQLNGYIFNPPYRVVNVPASRTHQDFAAISMRSRVYLPLTHR